MMIKKMMLLAMAAGALIAFGVPTVARAQTLTENSQALKVGAEVTATSTNLVKTTGLGTITCAKVTFHFEVTANGEGGSGASTVSSKTEGCDLKTPSGLIGVTITDEVTSATFALGEGGVGTSTTTFVSHIPAAGASCHEAGTPGVTYDTNSDELHVRGALGGPCGQAEIHGDFTLETANGTPVIID